MAGRSAVSSPEEPPRGVGVAGPSQVLRVVYVGHSAQLSGAELALLRLLPHVPGVQAHVVLAEDGPLVPRLRAAGATVEVLALPARTAELRRGALGGALPILAVVDTAHYVLRLVRRLLELGPDLVHTNSAKAHIYGGLAARLTGVPQVWHVRDRVSPDYLPSWLVALVRVAARRLPAAVVANSASTLETVPGAPTVAGVPPVLHDPVVPGSPESGRRPGEGLVVGMLGRLSPWKGQDLFLRAFARVAQDRQGLVARIIGSAMFGEDGYERELHALVEEAGLRGAVQFTGFTEDVPAALAQLDVLVHASVLAEPFGQVVIEGLAAGLAVVASGEGGPAEVITDGVDGVLFTPRDEDSLSEVLGRVADDAALRRRLGEGGRARSGDFDPAVIGRQLRRVYDGVLA